jgi:MbtH protein
MDEDKEEKFKVLVNAEEQYSFWPEWKEIPKGWKDTGFVGTKPEAGEYVKKVWTDMRPLSLRKWMDEHANDSTES